MGLCLFISDSDFISFRQVFFVWPKSSESSKFGFPFAAGT